MIKNSSYHPTISEILIEQLQFVLNFSGKSPTLSGEGVIAIHSASVGGVIKSPVLRAELSGEFLGELRGVFLTDSVPGMACSERSLMAAEISSICSKSLMEDVMGVKV